MGESSSNMVSANLETQRNASPGIPVCLHINSAPRLPPCRVRLFGTLLPTPSKVCPLASLFWLLLPGSACHLPALSNNVLVLHHDLPTFLQPLSLCEAVLGLPNSPKLTATGGLRHAISVGSSRTGDPQLCPFSSRKDVISRFAL